MAANPGPVGPRPGSTNTYRNGRSIFRPQALQHYRQSQERIELPRLATPRALTLLWIVAAAFVLLGAAIGSQVMMPAG